MENLTPTNVLLAFLGLFLHVLIKYRKGKKQGVKLSFIEWVYMDTLSITISVMATLVILIMLPDILDMINLKTTDDGAASQKLVAFLGGYSNQSLIKNFMPGKDV